MAKQKHPSAEQLGAERLQQIRDDLNKERNAAQPPQQSTEESRSWRDRLGLRPKTPETDALQPPVETVRQVGTTAMIETMSPEVAARLGELRMDVVRDDIRALNDPGLPLPGHRPQSPAPGQHPNTQFGQ